MEDRCIYNDSNTYEARATKAADKLAWSLQVARASILHAC